MFLIHLHFGTRVSRLVPFGFSFGFLIPLLGARVPQLLALVLAITYGTRVSHSFLGYLWLFLHAPLRGLVFPPSYLCIYAWDSCFPSPSEARVLILDLPRLGLVFPFAIWSSCLHLGYFGFSSFFSAPLEPVISNCSFWLSLIFCFLLLSLGLVFPNLRFWLSTHGLVFPYLHCSVWVFLLGLFPFPLFSFSSCFDSRGRFVFCIDFSTLRYQLYARYPDNRLRIVGSDNSACALQFNSFIISFQLFNLYFWFFTIRRLCSLLRIYRRLEIHFLVFRGSVCLVGWTNH